MTVAVLPAASTSHCVRRQEPGSPALAACTDLGYTIEACTCDGWTGSMALAVLALTRSPLASTNQFTFLKQSRRIILLPFHIALRRLKLKMGLENVLVSITFLCLLPRVSTLCDPQVRRVLRSSHWTRVHNDMRET